MITNKNKLIAWAALATMAFLGSMFSLMNFIAAVNLGYDITPQGKQIISNWGYAIIGLMVSSIVFWVLTIKSWYSRKKTTK